VGSDNYMNLGENFIQEGLANRITPFSTFRTDERGNLVAIEGVKNFDTEKTYQNVMERYKYGGLTRPGLYLDETVMRMCYTHRNLMGMLAKNLLNEGKDEKALAVLQKCEKEIPYYNVPVNFRSGSFDMAETYALLGKKEQALNIVGELWKNADQYMKYYLSLSPNRFAQSHTDCMTQLYVMQRVIQITGLVDDKLADKMEEKLNVYYNAYAGRGGQM
jgi:tetratricopeptide (TPR) repeat protein